MSMYDVNTTQHQVHYPILEMNDDSINEVNNGKRHK